MRRRQFFQNTIALIVASGGVAACARFVPITTIGSTLFRGTATIEQREFQIRRAGAGQDWAMEDVRPGVIQATLSDHSDQAVVNITYDASMFTIEYVSSQNLQYTGTTIHRNYNKWVDRLRKEIVEGK